MSSTSGRLSAVSIIYNFTYPHSLPILCHLHYPLFKIVLLAPSNHDLNHPTHPSARPILKLTPNHPQTETASLIQSLVTHRVNTLSDLRQIEKSLLQSPTQDTTTHLTNAWAYYVNSNSLLNEIRNLTRNYPFSAECIDEAKWGVMGDAMSVRSWNLCWLVLKKIGDE